MMLFGHRFIESKKFYHIEAISSVHKTPSNSTIYLPFSENNLDIIQFAQENQISFALHVNNIKELIYAKNLGASYITIEQDLAVDAQKVANDYLFDAKILAFIENEVYIGSRTVVAPPL